MSRKALVLEDSTATRKVLVKILAQLDFETTEACDGIDGLSALPKLGLELDLVLADWNMPRMSGLEFLRSFRSDARYASVPFIMVTTETELSSMVDALSAGANEYLMKPFTPEMLAAKLRILGVSRN